MVRHPKQQKKQTFFFHRLLRFAWFTGTNCLGASKSGWWWLEHGWIMTFQKQLGMEFHHPNWLSLHHFSEGWRKPTNQIGYSIIYHTSVLYYLYRKDCCGRPNLTLNMYKEYFLWDLGVTTFPSDNLCSCEIWVSQHSLPITCVLISVQAPRINLD